MQDEFVKHSEYVEMCEFIHKTLKRFRNEMYNINIKESPQNIKIKAFNILHKHER